jgi:hypothetical protein
MDKQQTKPEATGNDMKTASTVESDTQSRSSAGFPLKTVAVAIFVLIVVTGIFAASFYYLVIEKNREKFPETASTVDGEALEEQDYAKAELYKEPDTISFYYPSYWTAMNEDIAEYSDLLNGTSIHVVSRENTLGELKNQACEDLSREMEKTLLNNEVYSGVVYASSAITTPGDLRGCYAEYAAEVAMPTAPGYRIVTYSIFREEQIHMFIARHPQGLEYEREQMETVLSSIAFGK